MVNALNDAFDECPITKGTIRRERNPLGDRSCVIGFYKFATPEPYACKWSRQHPEHDGLIVRACERVSELYRQVDAAQYGRQKALVDPEFTVGDSAFTTVTANEDYQCPPHKDKGNLPYLSGLLMLSDCEGGELELMEENIKIGCKKGRLVFFNGMEHLHQVLPFSGQRRTMVFYGRRNLTVPEENGTLP